VWYPRRRPDPLEQLLRARFSAFVTLPGGLHAMVTVTRLVVIVRVFRESYCGDPERTWHLDRREAPESLHDGQGFNLDVLREFLSGLGISHSAQESKVKHTRNKKRLALYASMARMTRQKQRGGSCLMLPCQAIRQYIPALSPETVKFYLLAAANGDDMGIAFGATDYFWRLGYHPEKSGKRMRDLESLGLMRYVRKDAYDPVTRRRMKDVYQFNPELYYVRKGRRAAALALSDTPFCIMPTLESPIGEPDRKVRGNPDRNQSLEPKPESKSKNQSQSTKSKNHHHHQNSAFENGGDGKNSRRDGNSSAAAQEQRQGQEQKASLPAPNGASQTPAPHGAKTPQPPSSERPPSRKADFEQPLADDSAELLAQMIKSDFGTRLWQARELVCEFGVAHVAKARDMVIEEKRKRYVKTEIGLMRHWLGKGMVAVEEQARVYNPYDDGHGFVHAGD